jgi:hypothetical protein
LGRACFPLYQGAQPKPSLDGERASPLAKLLLGAEHGVRPPIVSRIIVQALNELKKRRMI